MVDRAVDMRREGTGELLEGAGLDALAKVVPAGAGPSLRGLAEAAHGPHEPWWRHREVRQAVADSVGEGHRAWHSGMAVADWAAENEALVNSVLGSFLGCGAPATREERDPTRRYAKRVRAVYREADAILGHTAATMMAEVRKQIDHIAEQAAAD